MPFWFLGAFCYAKPGFPLQFLSLPAVGLRDFRFNPLREEQPPIGDRESSGDYSLVITSQERFVYLAICSSGALQFFIFLATSSLAFFPALLHRIGCAALGVKLVLVFAQKPRAFYLVLTYRHQHFARHPYAGQTLQFGYYIVRKAGNAGYLPSNSHFNKEHPLRHMLKSAGVKYKLKRLGRRLGWGSGLCEGSGERAGG
jgi:hypothetical protein